MTSSTRSACLLNTNLVPSVVSLAQNYTYTTDDILTGFIKRDPNGAARTDTLPTASQLITSLHGALGSGFNVTNTYLFLLSNESSDVSNTNIITLSAGTGITMKNSVSLSPSQLTLMAIYITSSSTIDMYSTLLTSTSSSSVNTLTTSSITTNTITGPSGLTLSTTSGNMTLSPNGGSLFVPATVQKATSGTLTIQAGSAGDLTLNAPTGVLNVPTTVRKTGAMNITTLTSGDLTLTAASGNVVVNNVLKGGIIANNVVATENAATTLTSTQSGGVVYCPQSTHNNTSSVNVINLPAPTVGFSVVIVFKSVGDGTSAHGWQITSTAANMIGNTVAQNTAAGSSNTNVSTAKTSVIRNGTTNAQAVDYVEIWSDGTNHYFWAWAGAATTPWSTA